MRPSTSRQLLVAEFYFISEKVKLDAAQLQRPHLSRSAFTRTSAPVRDLCDSSQSRIQGNDQPGALRVFRGFRSRLNFKLSLRLRHHQVSLRTICASASRSLQGGKQRNPRHAWRRAAACFPVAAKAATAHGQQARPEPRHRAFRGGERASWGLIRSLSDMPSGGRAPRRTYHAARPDALPRSLTKPRPLLAPSGAPWVVYCSRNMRARLFMVRQRHGACCRWGILKRGSLYCVWRACPCVMPSSTASAEGASSGNGKSIRLFGSRNYRLHRRSSKVFPFWSAVVILAASESRQAL